MINSYCIAEHKTGGPSRTLRFLDKSDLEEYIRINKLTEYVKIYYDLPREVNTGGRCMLDIIKSCIDRKEHDPLPWERP